MKVKLEPCRHCGNGVFLPISDVVLNEMGWNMGDDITIDVGHSGDHLILFKPGVPKGRLVVTGVTDKSREIQAVGDEIV